MTPLPAPKACADAWGIDVGAVGAMESGRSAASGVSLGRSSVREGAGQCLRPEGPPKEPAEKESAAPEGATRGKRHDTLYIRARAYIAGLLNA